MIGSPINLFLILVVHSIVVAFTIQPNQTRLGTEPAEDEKEFVIPRPIQGLMTNHGYMVDDPKTPNRSSIWFSGGSIEVQDEIADAEIWRQIFDESLAPRRDSAATANLLAAQLLLGAHTTTSSAVAAANPGLLRRVLRRRQTAGDAP